MPREPEPKEAAKPVRSFSERLSYFREMLVNLAVILLMFVAVSFVIRETFRSTVVKVEPIQIPKQLADRGYTPRVVSQHIIEEVTNIRDIVVVDLKEVQIPSLTIRNPESSGPDFVLPAIGISIKSIAAYLRSVLPLRDTIVSGELLYSEPNEDLSLRLRIDGKRVSTFHFSFSEVSQSKEVIGELLQKGAHEIVKQTWPRTLLPYYYFSQRNAREWKKLAGFIFADNNQLEAQQTMTVLGSILHTEADDVKEEKEEAVEVEPNDAPAYVNRGRALARKGDDDGAIAKYEKAVGVDSNYAPAYANWGRALARKGDDDGAIAKYEKAVEVDSNYAAAYVNWGFELYNNQNYKGAIKKYKQAICIDPEAFDYLKLKIKSLKAKLR